MSHIAIVDYGMCNLDSVARATEECGFQPRITDQEADIRTATHVILPGVGSFSDAMRRIRDRSLDRILVEHVREKQIPFLGICLGMQLLASRGFEGGQTDGLGWIEGDVVRLEPKQGDRIPHVGWNEVNFTEELPLFRNIPAAKDFYFVHSYHLRCAAERDVLARTPYCGSFTSAIARDTVFGVQFHPEKSQRPGLQVLRNFLDL